MNYAIEQNVPIPPNRGPGVVNPDSLLGTLRRMQVGESVLVEKRSSVGSFSKLPGKKFTSRTVEGGTRIWRVS